MISNNDKSFLTTNAFENLQDPHSHFELTEIIGSGTYGQVYRGVHLRTQIVVAIKTIKVREKYINDNKKELEILRKYSDHENICKFFGAFIAKDSRGAKNPNLWVVMELCQGGTITRIIRCFYQEGKKIKERWCLYFIKGILKGLEYLHSKGVIHRDIKSQNVMLDKYAVIKLVDFGVSAQLNNIDMAKKTMIGTPYWMAPEVIMCSKNPNMSYNSKCDIWSTGITAIELADGYPPLTKLSPVQVLKAITSKNPPNLKNRFSRTKNYRKMVTQCLFKNPEKRPSAKDLLMDKMFVNFKKKEKKTTEDIIKYIGSFHRGNLEK